jgi:hypothetical protein
MKRTIKLTESELFNLINRIISEQVEMGLTPEYIKSKGIELQTELDKLSDQLKNKLVTINDRKYYILSITLSSLFKPRKKDNFLEGEIKMVYSEKPEGSKMRQQIIVAFFKTDDKPMMVSNEFSSLFPDSFTGAGPYRSSELQNYLNKVVSQIF